MKGNPEKELLALKSKVLEEGSYFESLMQHPGWTLLEDWINKHKKPERLVINEKVAATSSLAVQNHISGQIYILEKMVGDMKRLVERKNKIVRDEQLKQTSPDK